MWSSRPALPPRAATRKAGHIDSDRPTSAPAGRDLVEHGTERNPGRRPRRSAAVLIPHGAQYARPGARRQCHERWEDTQEGKDNGVSNQVKVKFRRSAALAVAAGITVIGGIPLLAESV